MIGGMNRDGMGLAVLAEIIVRAFGMHALEPSAVDGFLATIASSVVHWTSCGTATNVIIFLRHLDERVRRVLFISDAKARGACIEIRACQAFISSAHNPRVAEIACSKMSSWYNTVGTWGCFGPGRSARCLSFAVSTKDSMYDDPTGFLDFEELVEGVMSFSRT